jgi:hypothetical protein
MSSDLTRRQLVVVTEKQTNFARQFAKLAAGLGFPLL